MSSTYNNREQILQGNSRTLFCAVEDASGIVNLSGYAANFYAQKFPPRAGDPIDISIGSTSIDTSNGVITFDITETDTSINVGDYIYEIIIDDGTHRISVVQDKLQILNSIKPT